MRLQRCLIPTKDIREIAKHFGWNPVIAANRVGMWQTQTNSSDIPSISQMEEFADALKDDADFQKPLKDLINATGKMVYSFNETTKRPDIVASSTLEAIQKGERTATTRYEHLDYWGKVKAGDIVQFNDEKGNGVYVRITSPLAKLSPDTSAEEWSKKEGWSVEYFEKNVRPRIDEAYQMEYEYLGDVDKFTHAPYYTGNITPSENTIFVFGSNPEGRHGAGAAKIAVDKFGAKYGVGEGLTGNAYALPTKDISKHPWARTAKNNYEVSSQGDKRFSALYATFKEGTTIFGHDVSGRTIESVYQHGIKQGDWVTNNNSKTGAPKSKEIIKGNTEDASYNEGYLPLWQEWAKQNPELIEELRQNTVGKTLTDKFASTKVSQARALAEILNSGNHLRSIPKNVIVNNIKNLYATAKQNPGKVFKIAFRNGLTETTLNGYNGQEMIEMFIEAGPIPANIMFSKEWVDTGLFSKASFISIISRLNGFKTLNTDSIGEYTVEAQKEFIPEEINGAPKKVHSSRPQSLFDNVRKLNSAFTPLQLEKRIKNIAYEFSNLIDVLYANKIKELRNKVESFPEKSLERFQVIGELNALQSTLNGRDVFISNYLNIQDVIAGVKQSVKEKQLQNLNKERTEENKEVLDYRLDLFNKMLDNIDLLLMEAMTEIEANEGIRIVLSQAVDAKGKVVLIGFTEKNTSNEDENDDDDDRVVSGNSGWAFSFNKQDPRQSITQGVRNVLRHIPAIEQDSFDDLGYTQYLDSDYVYATILNGCSWMIDSDDFYIKKLDENGEEDIYMPAIDKLALKYPWMAAVQNYLYALPELLPQFYTCFRRDFKPYYMLSSGKLASLNKEMSLANAISSITRNYEQGIMLHEDSIFDKNGNLNKKQKENIELVKSLQEDLQHDSWSAENYNTLRELLNIIGIETDVALDEFLDLYKTNSEGVLDKTNNDITYKSISKILTNIRSILENINEVPEQAHLISHFNQEYAAIAKIVGSVTRFNRGMTFRQDGDAYSSYQFPNYATTLFKKILSEDPLRRTSIFNFYKQSDYFHFNGKFRNYMLRELESNNALVEELREGSLLSINMLRLEKLGTMAEFLQETEAVPYDKWTAALVKQVFIKSYFRAGSSSKSNMQYAYYRFPIFADVTEAMLFKFRRFTGNYKEQILPLLRDVVMQEFSRLGLVERRENNSNKIGNFDKNGDKFFFFPEMNDYLVEADYSTMKSYYMGFKNTDKWEKALKILKSLNILDKDGNEIKEQEAPEKIRVQFKDAVHAYKAQGKNNTVISIIDSTIKSILDKQFRVFMSKNILDNIPLIESLVEDNIIPKSELESALKALEGKKRDNLKELKVEEKKEKKEITSQYATLEEALEEYYWNDSLMLSQIILLTVIDPAYFKFDGGVDFQKRYKQIYAAGRKLFIHSKYGRKYEKTIYLSDRITISRRYNAIKKLFDKAVENKYITKEQRDTILAKFSEINNTDAQAFRELSSMRAVLDMLGEWDDATMGQSYERIINGEFDPQDFETIWQILKPFMYTIVAKDDGVGGKMLVPHQNKNSEFLILAAYQMVAAATSGHTKLKALSKFMLSHEIDVAMFDSAVKAGVLNPIDLNISIAKLEKIKDDIWEQINNAAKKALKSKYKEGRTKNNFYSGTEYLLHNDYITQEQYDSLMDFVEPTEEEMLQILEKECFDENGQENLNTIHIMEYNDYMLASPNPEHWIDSKVVDGSQKRNLLPADMPDDADFRVVVDGVEMTKQQVLDHYDGIIIENLIDDFFDVKNSVSNKVALQKSLIQQVKGNPKYSRDFTNCLQLTKRNDKMVFAVPLDFPSVRAKVAELILAKFKNGITRQKARGGSCVLVADTQNILNIVLEDGSYLNTKDSKAVELAKKHNFIKGFECFLPAWTKDLYEGYLITRKEGKKIWQELDIEKLRKEAPELLEMSGIRIPTEDKYSITTLIVKGFMPALSGSAIMLPADITTIVGADFDVDKMFIRLYNYTKTEDGKLEKVQYDYTKSPHEQSREARENALLDIELGIMKNKHTANALFNPGNFDPLKKEARIATILTEQSNRGRSLFNIWQERHNIEYNDFEGTIKSLNNASLDELKKFEEEFQEIRSILSLDTYVYNHQQNMVGAALIGMFANNTTMQAKMQTTNLALKDLYTFVINGRRVKSLHDAYVEKNGIKQRVSKTCSYFSAASVDNVKDPCLKKLNQNTETASITGFMLRAGMDEHEIMLLFKQPFINTIINNIGIIPPDPMILKHIDNLNDMFGTAISVKEIMKNGFSDYNFTSEMLALNIAKYHRYIRIQDKEERLSTIPLEERKELVENLVRALMLFRRISKASEQLRGSVQIARADSPNGAISNEIHLARKQVKNVAKYLSNETKDGWMLENISDVMGNNVINIRDTKEIMRKKLNSPDVKVRRLQAFYSLGIELALDVISGYFISQSKSALAVFDLIESQLPKELKDKAIKVLYEDLINYMLSNTETFGDEKNGLSFEEKRDYYLYLYPQIFSGIIKDYPNLSSSPAIINLRITDGQIVMENSGSITETERAVITTGFDSLLFGDDEVGRQLAFDLFMYSYYNEGFVFRHNSYGRFFSAAFLNEFPDVLEALDGSDARKIQNFFEQWVAQKSNVVHFKYVEKDSVIFNSDGSIIVDKNNIPINNNYLLPDSDKGQPYTYIQVTVSENETKLYIFNTLYENGALYSEVPLIDAGPVEGKMHKFNANKTARQIAEIAVDSERVTNIKRLNAASYRQNTAAIRNNPANAIDSFDDGVDMSEVDVDSFETADIDIDVSVFDGVDNLDIDISGFDGMNIDVNINTLEEENATYNEILGAEFLEQETGEIMC